MRYEFGGAYIWRGLFSGFYGISFFVSIFNTFPVNQFRSRELRKLHFKESNYKNFLAEHSPETPPEVLDFTTQH